MHGRVNFLATKRQTRLFFLSSSFTNRITFATIFGIREKKWSEIESEKKMKREGDGERRAEEEQTASGSGMMKAQKSMWIRVKKNAVQLVLPFFGWFQIHKESKHFCSCIMCYYTAYTIYTYFEITFRILCILLLLFLNCMRLSHFQCSYDNPWTIHSIFWRADEPRGSFAWNDGEWAVGHTDKNMSSEKFSTVSVSVLIRSKYRYWEFCQVLLCFIITILWFWYCSVMCVRRINLNFTIALHPFNLANIRNVFKCRHFTVFLFRLGLSYLVLCVCVCVCC